MRNRTRAEDDDRGPGTADGRDSIGGYFFYRADVPLLFITVFPADRYRGEGERVRLIAVRSREK